MCRGLMVASIHSWVLEEQLSLIMLVIVLLVYRLILFLITDLYHSIIFHVNDLGLQLEAGNISQFDVSR